MPVSLALKRVIGLAYTRIPRFKSNEDEVIKHFIVAQLMFFPYCVIIQTRAKEKIEQIYPSHPSRSYLHINARDKQKQKAQRETQRYYCSMCPYLQRRNSNAKPTEGPGENTCIDTDFRRNLLVGTTISPPEQSYCMIMNQIKP